MSTLGSTFFSELSPKFFRLLGGPNARLYLDVVDGLEREMSTRGDAMERVEVLGIIDQILVPGIQLEQEPDEEAASADADSPPNKILRRLIVAGWLEEERRSDYRHVLFLEPAALTLIEALRTIVSQNIASFTGKLRLVCDRLSALRHHHSRKELIWEQLRHCLVEVKTGLRELRSIRKQVERYARRQLTTTTIAETLDIIYNEFSALITQQCYRELIHARLEAVAIPDHPQVRARPEIVRSHFPERKQVARKAVVTDGGESTNQLLLVSGESTIQEALRLILKGQMTFQILHRFSFPLEARKSGQKKAPELRLQAEARELC
jgi:hypothetical protein